MCDDVLDVCVDMYKNNQNNNKNSPEGKLLVKIYQTFLVYLVKKQYHIQVEFHRKRITRYLTYPIFFPLYNFVTFEDAIDSCPGL